MINLDVIFGYAGTPDNNSINAPFTITRELYCALTKHFRNVRYVKWDSREIPSTTTESILLLHPHSSPDTPAWKLFESKVKLKCLIFPFHHAMPEFNIRFDKLVRQADHVFAISGKHWIDTINISEFSHWQRTMTNVDMAVDCNVYQYLRTNIHGRDFVYIGSDRIEKGLMLLYSLFKNSKHNLHIYGHLKHNNPLLKLPNIVYHGHQKTDAILGRTICDSCITALNSSLSDACPTTILEAAAWGLSIACTEGSGYDNKLFWNLSNDHQKNHELLNYIADIPDDELLSKMRAIREYVETNHNWTRFTSTIIDGLIKLI